MDLFSLDKIMVEFIKRLLTDPAFQFSVLLGIWIFVSVIFPGSKNSKGDKK